MLRNTVQSMQKPKVPFARRLRQRQTNGEAVLWDKLRAKRFHGLKFRRQVPLGRYVVDFLCVERRLIIEVDGDSHYQPGAQEYDRKREEYLRSLGFEVFRCGNREVRMFLQDVLTRLGQMLGYY